MKNNVLIASVIILIIAIGVILFLIGSNNTNNTNKNVTSNNNPFGNKITTVTTTNVKNITTNNTLNTSVKVLSSQNNFYNLNSTVLNNTLGKSWHFSQEIEAPGTPGSSEENITLYNYTNNNTNLGNEGITFFRVGFNSSSNASEFYDIQVANIRTKLNFNILNYTLQSDSPAIAFNSSNTNATYKNAIITMTPFGKYFYEAVLFYNKNNNLENTSKKLVSLLQVVENKTTEPQISNVSNIYLNNIYGGNWKELNESFLKLNSTEKTFGENYIQLQNFSNDLGYNLTVGTVNFNDNYNALSVFNDYISNIPGINGAISNGHAAHIFLNKSSIIPSKNNVGAMSINGNYISIINIYNNKINITENLVLPGEINLLERIQNAKILVNNQTTSLSNLSRLPPTSTNVTLINISTLNKTFGGNWRFVEGNNVTAGLPKGGIKYTIENFTNNLENFTLSVGNFINTTSVVGVYDGGLGSLSNQNNLKIGHYSFDNGLSYTQVFGVITAPNNQTENLLGEIYPYGNYLIQTSLYSQNKTMNLYKYNNSIKNIQEKIMNQFESNIISGNATYLTTEQLSLILGNNWNITSRTQKNNKVNGSIGELTLNYTTTKGDLVKQSIVSFNTENNASNDYNNINTELFANNTSKNVVSLALDNEYSYTITNNTQFTNSKNGVSIIAPYGNKVIKISLYPNSTVPITISNSGLLLLTLLNYTEN